VIREVVIHRPGIENSPRRRGRSAVYLSVSP
jgi:hypothetical protein